MLTRNTWCDIQRKTIIEQKLNCLSLRVSTRQLVGARNNCSIAFERAYSSFGNKAFEEQYFGLLRVSTRQLVGARNNCSIAFERAYSSFGNKAFEEQYFGLLRVSTRQLVGARNNCSIAFERAYSSFGNKAFEEQYFGLSSFHSSTSLEEIIKAC